MIRRFARLLLVPALLANQAAFCFGHVHAGNANGDQAVRPHVHVSGHLHDHDSPGHDSRGHHSHEDHSHRHHQDSDHQEFPNQPSKNSGDTPGDLATTPVGHESDAIYFGEQETILNKLCKTDLGIPVWTFVAVQVEWPRESGPVISEEYFPPGHLLPYSCAIYLQKRALLI